MEAQTIRLDVQKKTAIHIYQNWNEGNQKKIQVLSFVFLNRAIQAGGHKSSQRGYLVHLDAQIAVLCNGRGRS